MTINGNLKLATINVANLATGGVIGTAITTVDICSVFLINQTTANQTLTLPPPTNTLAGNLVTIGNIGSVNFTISGINVSPNSLIKLIWSGTAWLIDSNIGRNQGTSISVASIIAGNNTITHNLNLSTGNFSKIVFDAFDANGNEVSFRRVTASDTANAIVLNSTSAMSNITFYISPLS